MELKCPIYVLLILLVATPDCDSGPLSTDLTVLFLRSRFLTTYIPSLISRMFNIDSDKYIEDARNQNKMQPKVPDETPFPCKTKGFRSPTRPTSIHQLRPGDIDVVAGLGHSLIAGVGITSKNVIHMAAPNMGLSFSTGGLGTWREYLTIPNILKEFNPNLIGYSVGSGARTDPQSGFNQGLLGALTDNLMMLAEELVDKIRRDPKVDMKNHWKLITIMIGENDVCSNSCVYKSTISIRRRMLRNLRETLDYLKKHLPRTIINLIGIADVDFASKLELNGLGCTLRYVLCFCYMLPSSPEFRHVLLKLLSDISNDEKSLATGGRYDSTDDFAVIYQPFFTRLHFLRLGTSQTNITDYSYFAPDCLHHTQKAQAAEANALWNNMLEPVGNKTDLLELDAFERFLCPSEDAPYIFTNKNSRSFLLNGKQ